MEIPNKSKPVGIHAGTRISFIDYGRGLLILLMSSSHALTLANVSSSSFLRSGWWLPRGWAFDGFITLSGFVSVVVYDWTANKQTTQHRLLQRAWQVLAVMFVSNVFLLVGKYSITNELEKIRSLNWWIGLITLRTEYSISGILLPTGAFLLLLPLLFRANEKWGLPRVAAALLLFSLFLQVLQYILAGRASDSHLLDVLLYTGAGGFPVFPLVSRGALGFVVGLAWNRAPALSDLRIRGAILLYFLALQGIHRLPLSAAVFGLLYPLNALARFLLILLVGAIITERAAVGQLLGFLPLMGRHALFSFIMHRFVMQTLALLAKHLLSPTPAELLYWIYLVGTLGVLALLCSLRERFAPFDLSLKKLYL